MSEERVRVAVFWRLLPPYACACIRALHSLLPSEILVFRYAKKDHVNYSEDSRRLPVPIHVVRPDVPARQEWKWVKAMLEEFRPQVALVTGWITEVFNRAARWMRANEAEVVALVDNPWRGTLRQRLGCLVARSIFPRRYTAMWVPGQRSLPLARRLGYTGNRLLQGLYSADTDVFGPVGARRFNSGSNRWPRSFLFVGRMVETKGVADLLEAYRAYRAMVPDGWELWLAGIGPLAERAHGLDGVRLLGFLDPTELAKTMSEAGCLILPSYYEPWGVVVHEATAAGLPVLCSRECGSSDYLVGEDRNGYLFSAGDVATLAHLMLRISAHCDLAGFSRHSLGLSKQFSPQRWAYTLMKFVGTCSGVPGTPNSR